MIPLNQAELLQVIGICQTFRFLYYRGPRVVFRTSYGFLKSNIQNSDIDHIGNAKNSHVISHRLRANAMLTSYKHHRTDATL